LLSPFQIKENGQLINTLTKRHLLIFGHTQKSSIPKLLVFLNFDITNIWVMLANNYSLAPSYIRPLRVLFVTPWKLTHGPTYSSTVKIPTFMLFALNATIRPLPKLKNYVLVSSSHSCIYILMNAGIYDFNPPDNTVPPWLLPCVCQSPRCHCDARLKLDILCVRGVPYKHEPPQQPSPNVIIQYIEFTYCNDRFSHDKLPPNKPNTARSSIIFVQEVGMLRLLL
jgi:hypothetical protein